MRNSVIGSFVGFLLGVLVLAACGGSSVPSSAPLEARVTELEAVLDKLCTHITVDPTGKLTIQATSICLDAMAAVDIKATTIDIKAMAALKLDGALVQLNGGARPVSGQGDTTAGGVIATGTPTVLIP